MILRIPFLFVRNLNIWFAEISNLIWRNYTIVEILHIIKTVKFIDKRVFVKAVLNENTETFRIQVLALLVLSIHLRRTI